MNFAFPLGVAITLILPLTPLAAQEGATVERPRLNPNVRQAEDWYTVREARPQPAHFADPLKHIALSDDGSIWLSIGGQARLRFEGWNNFNFVGDNDDTFWPWRVRAHADLHVGEHLRFFVEGKSASLLDDRDLPGGRRAVDVDTLALQQAFAEVRWPVGQDDAAALTLRGGRQELLFGRQRLVSSLDWSNTRRTWDGIRADVAWGSSTLTGFYTWFAPVDKYDFNDTDRDDAFYGLHLTTATPWEGLSLDGYFFGRSQDDLDEDRYTAGGRLFGKVPGTGFDYDLEGAYQFGEHGDVDIAAWFLASQVGYTFADVAATPRVFGGFDYASGDDDAGDDTLGTFNQLFPLGHAYLGYVDVIGRQNIIAGHLGVAAKPTDKLFVELTGHAFWRAETDDSLYQVAGASLRGPGGSDERFVGTEVDLLLRYQFDANLVGLAGYSRFFSGGFIDDTGPSRDIDFVYVQLEYTF